MTFDVKGMTCAACSAHVEKSVRKLEGVSDVSVSLLTNSMEVQFDPDTVTPDAICKAVASGGYSASPRGEAAAAAAQQAERTCCTCPCPRRCTGPCSTGLSSC